MSRGASDAMDLFENELVDPLCQTDQPELHRWPGFLARQEARRVGNSGIIAC